MDSTTIIRIVAGLAAILLGADNAGGFQGDLARRSISMAAATGISAPLAVAAVQSQSSQRTPAKPSGRMEALKKTFDANDRVDIGAAGRVAVLGEPTQISMAFHKAGLGVFYASQLQYKGPEHNVRNYVEGGQKILNIEYHPDGSGSITVVPMRLGELVVDLVGRYPDSGIVHKQVVLSVQPPQRKANTLTVRNNQSSTTRVLLSATGKPGELGSYAWLDISASYDGVATSLAIDPRFATFRVVNWSGRAVPIRMDDQTGELNPISPGQALVEITFGGQRSLTCVDVEEVLVPSQSYYQHNCQTLLSPGEKLGFQQ